MAKGSFFACYLLTSLDPKFKEHAYIGFTVNPLRRIRQHNGDLARGGAKRTSRKRPWEIVCIVYGFPTQHSALQFEWSWQHPTASKKVREAAAQVKGVGHPLKLKAKVRILYEMLHVSPWDKLALKVLWISDKYRYCLTGTRLPPVSVTITNASLESIQHLFGVEAEGESESDTSEDESLPVLANQCFLCENEELETTLLECTNRKCRCISHVLCLAASMLSLQPSTQLLPTNGTCPRCKTALLWGDIIASYTRRLALEEKAKKKEEKKQAKAMKQLSSTKVRCDEEDEDSDFVTSSQAEKGKAKKKARVALADITN